MLLLLAAATQRERFGLLRRRRVRAAHEEPAPAPLLRGRRRQCQRRPRRVGERSSLESPRSCRIRLNYIPVAPLSSRFSARLPPLPQDRRRVPDETREKKKAEANSSMLAAPRKEQFLWGHAALILSEGGGGGCTHKTLLLEAVEDER